MMFRAWAAAVAVTGLLLPLVVIGMIIVVWFVATLGVALAAYAAIFA